MASTKSNRSAYKGSRRNIVLSFDIGTTYSGISYSILDPGQCPTIQAVTRFPAQEIIGGASKVPSIVYYDKEGRVTAIGAEATKYDIEEAAIEEDWFKAEWFKLHLRSDYTTDKYVGHNVPPLPPNKTVVDVFADYLRYLLDCAESFIKDSQPNGRDLWSSTRKDMFFVLSHPNGWEGKEQSQMRKAVVKAGLVPDDPSGHKRVSFVTEGEASLHFAIENGVLSETMKGQGVVIVDAGGGTIDVSTYKRVGKTRTATFEEIAVPQCYFQGSVFVTFRAKDFVKDLLAKSSFTDDLDRICDHFDKTTKTRVRNATDPQYVRFGSIRDNDATCGIRMGQLKLMGADIAEFFQPSIDCIVQAIMEQKRTAHKEISCVVLVGGFAASDLLFERVQAQLTRSGLTLVRPDNRVNKAVSDGAISFFLDRYVRSRVARVSYGTEKMVVYDAQDPEHVKRSASMFIDCDGLPHVPGIFDVLLPKNTQVAGTKEFIREYTCNDTAAGSFRLMKEVVICYRGSQDNPAWMDVDSANFTTVCTLKAELSQIPRIESRNPAGDIYYSIDYALVLIFGLTEFQAQIQWFEGAVERRSPAEIIYEEL